jgi:hypothetical protein
MHPNPMDVLWVPILILVVGVVAVVAGKAWDNTHPRTPDPDWFSSSNPAPIEPMSCSGCGWVILVIGLVLGGLVAFILWFTGGG